MEIFIIKVVLPRYSGIATFAESIFIVISFRKTVSQNASCATLKI
jgi:hypothetical protein